MRDSPRFFRSGESAVKAWHQTLREPTIALISIIAFCSIYASWYPARNVPAIDFYQFWVVGQEVTEGQPGNVFSDLDRARLGKHYLEKARISGDRSRFRTAQERSTLDTFSTPFLYTVFSAFSSGDYEHDLVSYRSLSLLFLALSVAVLCRLLGYGLAPTLAAIPLFAAWFAPSLSDMSVGNVNHFQLGWLVLFLWTTRTFPTTAGHLLGGLLLGLGAMFKPNTALVIGMLMAAWLVGRQYRKLLAEMAGIAAGALIAFLGSSFAFGRVGIWSDWLSALSGLPDGLITVELGNYSPTRLLSDSLGIDTTWLIALACGGLALAAIIRGCSRRVAAPATEGALGTSGLEEILIIALAGIVTLLSSPLSWLHYFVAAIPMLLIALRPMGEPLRAGPSWTLTRAVAIVALIAVMIRPLVMLGLGEPRDRAILLCLATAALFVLGLRELIALRDVSSGPSDANRGTVESG